MNKMDQYRSTTSLFFYCCSMLEGLNIRIEGGSGHTVFLRKVLE